MSLCITGTPLQYLSNHSVTMLICTIHEEPRIPYPSEAMVMTLQKYPMMENRNVTLRVAKLQWWDTKSITPCTGTWKHWRGLRDSARPPLPPPNSSRAKLAAGKMTYSFSAGLRILI